MGVSSGGPVDNDGVTTIPPTPIYDPDHILYERLRQAIDLAQSKIQNEGIETLVDVTTELGKKVAALATVFTEINLRLSELIKDEVIEQQQQAAELLLNELANEAADRDEAARQLDLATRTLLALQGARRSGVAMLLVQRDP